MNYRSHVCRAAILVAVAACSPARATPNSFTPGDSAAVSAVRDQYVKAWMADDTSAVLALFEPGGKIIPSGKRAIVGHDRIRDHWWPQDGSTTKLLAFRWVPQELHGEGSLAVMRGESIVSWEYSKDATVSRDSSVSVNLTVFRRGTDGRWRIASQMWGPGLK